MDDQFSRGRDEIRSIREMWINQAESQYGRELDVLDEFLYFAQEWQEGFLKVAPFDPLDPQHMYSPIKSRDSALAFLFAESTRIAFELSTVLRHGLWRPAMATLRKLYETHIDAQFIELDMTGQVAFRWTHWGVAERAKLRPDDEIAQRECAISKKMFENEKEFGRHGYWAKVSKGQTTKPYRDLPSRAQYVDDSNLERFGGTQHAEFARAWRKELLAKTNALIHPKVVGNEDPLGPRILIFLTANYTFLTLIAYKNGVDDHTIMPQHETRGDHLFRYSPGNEHLIMIAQQLHQAFLRLTELLTDGD